MEIVKYNGAFDHIEIALKELGDKNPNFDKVVFVLGYNCFENLNFVKDKYPDYKVIIYQLEQLSNSKSPWWNNRTYNNLKQADEVWDFSLNNIKFLHNNKINVKYFPVPYCNGLKRLSPLSKDLMDIDFLFYGAMNERRFKVLGGIQNKLPKCKLITLFNVFGKELDEYIERSKIILNIHYYPFSEQEQVRVFYPIINNKCVLSEKSSINSFGSSIIECDYESLADRSAYLLKSGDWYRQAITSSQEFKTVFEHRK